MMTIKDRSYDLLSFLTGNEKSVNGHTVVARAKTSLSAHLGEDDGQHILRYQHEIPAVLRGKAFFVFTDWHHPSDHSLIACVDWSGGQWVLYWGWLGSNWDNKHLLLRRK